MLANDGPMYSHRVAAKLTFANRIDKQIIRNEVARGLKVLRPDRMYELRRDEDLAQYISSMDSSIEISAHQQTKSDCLEWIILPFLVSEAKSATGNHLHICGTQIAFPIWRLLNLQHNLEKYSGIEMAE